MNEKRARSPPVVTAKTKTNKHNEKKESLLKLRFIRNYRDEIMIITEIGYKCKQWILDDDRDVDEHEID